MGNLSKEPAAPFIFGDEFPENIPSTDYFPGEGVTFSPSVVARRIGELLVGEEERAAGRWVVNAIRRAAQATRRATHQVAVAYRAHREEIAAERRNIELLFVNEPRDDHYSGLSVNPALDERSAAMWAELDTQPRQEQLPDAYVPRHSIEYVEANSHWNAPTAQLPQLPEGSLATL